VPYGATGERQAVSDYKLNFLYTAGAYQPNLNDWSRLKFDKFLKNVMNRIRNHNNPKPKKEAKAKKGEEAKGEKGAAVKAEVVKIDKSRPKTADAKSLDIPQTVPGLKIKKEFVDQIVAGTKKIEYRTVNTAPKGFVAIIQTFTDEEPGRPAEVAAFARISHVTQANGEYEWHLTNVTPVKPYVVPNNKPGAIIWVKDVPVQGPKRLRKGGAASAPTKAVKTPAKASKKAPKSDVASLEGNHLFMRDDGAFQNAATGVSTVYLRRGAGKGYKIGPGQIDRKAGAPLLVDFVAVDEIPYGKVGAKVLNGLAPGLTSEEMLATMQGYYPGFTSADVVTVIRYRRR
jgi:hypothetical protein